MKFIAFPYPSVYLIFLLTLLMAACSEKSTVDPEPDPDPVESRSSWEVIQHEVLDKHCVSCHSAGTTFANQSGLVLTADVAYG